MARGATKATGEKQLRKKGKDKKPFRTGPKGKTWGIGIKLPAKVDMRHFVRWPQYVTRQRMKRVLLKRLKVPPAVNQFSATLSDGAKKELFAFCSKYKRETRTEKRERQRKDAEARAQDPKAPLSSAPASLVSGLQHVTRLVQTKRAKLVLIAHDVDKLELVIWLPALCHKLDIPYAIVKSKSVLGKFVGLKQAAVVAFNKVLPEDKAKFDKLVETINGQFTDRYDERMKTWGGLQKRKAKKQSEAQMARKEAERKEKARRDEELRQGAKSTAAKKAAAKEAKA